MFFPFGIGEKEAAGNAYSPQQASLPSSLPETTYIKRDEDGKQLSQEINPNRRRGGIRAVDRLPEKHHQHVEQVVDWPVDARKAPPQLMIRSGEDIGVRAVQSAEEVGEGAVEGGAAPGAEEADEAEGGEEGAEGVGF